MLAETHMKFYKPSFIVGSFKGTGIYNSTISTSVREKYEKRDAERYDIEGGGVSPGYDV